MEIHGPYNPIIVETIVPANRDEVYQAWTSEEGLRTFFSSHVEMELSVGGPFHILFNMDNPPGLRGADDMRIMAFEPGRMLAFDWNAPPIFPSIRPQRTHVTVYFEGTCGGGTRVTLAHDGWGTSQDWREVNAYFREAWGEAVLPLLRWRFENGPVDWDNRPDFSLQAQKSRLLQVYDAQQRIAQVFPGLERWNRDGLLVSRSPHEKRSFVAFSHLGEDGLDGIIAGLVADTAARGDQLSWKVYDHDTPASLKERLLAAGFIADEPEALMVLDMQDAPESFFSASSLDIRHMDRLEDLEAIRQIEESVWNENQDAVIDNLRRSLQENPDLVSIYAGYDSGQPAACAWTYFHPGTQFASFWGGSTLPASRGRGFYTALLAARAAEARQRGFRYLTVDASPMSQPILEKHGFLCLTFSADYNWEPAKTEK